MIIFILKFFFDRKFYFLGVTIALGFFAMPPNLKAKSNYFSVDLQKSSTKDDSSYTKYYDYNRPDFTNYTNYDLFQISVKKDSYMTGTKNSPLYLNYGLIFSSFESENSYLHGYGVLAEIRYGKGVSLSLGSEYGQVKGVVGNEGYDYSNDYYRNYSVVDSEYNSPMYLKLNLEHEFESVMMSFYYLQKDIKIVDQGHGDGDSSMQYLGLGIGVSLKL